MKLLTANDQLPSNYQLVTSNLIVFGLQLFDGCQLKIDSFYEELV